MPSDFGRSWGAFGGVESIVRNPLGEASMPSAVTHMLLSRHLADEVRKKHNEQKAQVLAAGVRFLTVGSVGPDLPYASVLDNDSFLKTHNEVADALHYERTNQLPLRAFEWIKDNLSKAQTVEEREQLDSYFCFYLGYCSHIVADGVMHPFVRDKVGEYDENKKAHRTLEMHLDVLLLHHFTHRSGEYSELNYTNLHDELGDILSEPLAKDLSSLHAQLISEVYGKEVAPELVLGWISGLRRLLAVAEGDHPRIYRSLEATDGYVYKNYVDLAPNKDEFLVLRKPKYWEENFLRREKVHMIDDCLPMYFSKMSKLFGRAYEYIYEDAAPLTEVDIPEINLDSGRMLAVGRDTSTVNLQFPEFWRS